MLDLNMRRATHIDLLACKHRRPLSASFLAAALFLPFAFLPNMAHAQASPEAKGLRTLGVIKSINDGTVTVTADTGEEVTATLQPDTRILRVAPDQKDLKNATPLKAEDLQAGDRVLVRGLPLTGAKTIKAVSVIVMKQADVSARQDRERDDWQKRGVGGLVKAVDAAAGTITISAGVAAPGAPAKQLVIHTSKDTTLRRYPPNSIRYEDTKPAPFDQIKVGDQVRARGTRSGDGNELKADEVISGSFRNIAGTVISVDASTSTITVQDLVAKKPATVKVSSSTVLKKLPPEIATRIAARFKGGAAGGGAQAGASGGGQRAAWQGAAGGGPAGGGASSGPPDLQRFLSRLPSSELADLKKGDALMIVSTDPGEGSNGEAITVLAGVEPILTAAPSVSLLSAWSLSSSAAEGGGAQ
jgi:hypothetical protein